VRHYEDTSPLSGPSTRRTNPLVWANEKWLQLTEGRPLEDCVEWITQDQLQSWAEGDEASGVPADATFRLQLRSSPIMLNLARTVVPLSPPSSTHAFCVITSQQDRVSTTSDHLVQDQGRSSTASTGSYFADPRTSLSTDVGPSVSEAGTGAGTAGADLASTGSFGVGRSSRAKSKRRIRPSEHQAATQELMHAAAEECWRRVEEIDWESTSLGPRSNWSEVVDPILSIVFQSKTQDTVWLGDDLRLI
jgi:hypothetical protein